MLFDGIMHHLSSPSPQNQEEETTMKKVEEYINQ